MNTFNFQYTKINLAPGYFKPNRILFYTFEGLQIKQIFADNKLAVDNFLLRAREKQISNFTGVEKTQKKSYARNFTVEKTQVKFLA